MRVLRHRVPEPALVTDDHPMPQVWLSRGACPMSDLADAVERALRPVTPYERYTDKERRAVIVLLANNRARIVAALRLAEAVDKGGAQHHHIDYGASGACKGCAITETLDAYRDALRAGAKGGL